MEMMELEFNNAMRYLSHMLGTNVNSMMTTHMHNIHIVAIFA